jgi:hypothetical protein
VFSGFPTSEETMAISLTDILLTLILIVLIVGLLI